MRRTLHLRGVAICMLSWVVLCAPLVVCRRPCGGVSEHVHLRVGLRATHCLSDVLRELKSVSSRWVHETLGLQSFCVAGRLRSIPCESVAECYSPALHWRTRRSTIVRARFARNISNSSSDTEWSLIFGMCFDSSPRPGLMSSSVDIPVFGTLSFLQINPYPAFYNDSTTSHLCRSRCRFALAENLPRNEFR